MKKIDQMSEVSDRLIGYLLGIKRIPTKKSGIEIVSEVFNDELNIDFNALIQMSNDTFIPIITLTLKFNNQQREELAELLYQRAQHEERGSERLLVIYEKLQLLYLYLAKHQKTYSFEQHWRLEEIACYLQEFSPTT